jgi:hypothetical protein
MPPLRRKRASKLSRRNTFPPITTEPLPQVEADDDSIEKAIAFTGYKELIEWWNSKKVDRELENLTLDIGSLKTG